ncbi:MAG: ABC transporter permease [Candidatus Aminicenantes bacterium]|nr:ABC transporter permease [Candidatus Aminicenantes bacterium]
MISWTAVYVLWLREIKRFSRARSRVLGSLAMPIFFMVSLGLGLNQVALPGLERNIGYLSFLVPGIIGMSLLFSSAFAGLSVLWDKEFGFLKEIMVAPVNRLSIVIGRVTGGTSIVIFQAIIILLFSFFLGFKFPGLFFLGLAFIFMILISLTFLGLGLIFASLMKDMQGFSLVMNFVIFPLFLLSGALYPIRNLPTSIRFLAYFDPLTYGVDGLRWSLLQMSSFPWILDLSFMVLFSLIMLGLGAFLFERQEST